MKTVTAKTKSGKTIHLPVFNADFEEACGDGSQGLCIACGEEASGVEPDARKYECESCNALKVYGLEELVMMGFVR